MNRIPTREFAGIAGWGLTLFLAFILMLLLSVPSSAAGNTYPAKPINLIVPMNPGGMLDLHAKIIGDRVSPVLGQPIIRVYKPGAGGALGISYAKRSKLDGYTWVVNSSSGIVLSPIVKKLDYTYEDFISLGIYAKAAMWLGVKADSKWKTLDDFIRDAKKRPGELSVGSYGKLTTGEFVVQELCRLAGIKLNFIPFRGCAKAMPALLGGHVGGYVCATSMGQLKAGTIRVLAIADYDRSPVLPGVKTFKELGYPIALPLWYSFYVPKGTPEGIVDKASNAMQEVFKRHGGEITDEFKRIEAVAYFHTLEESRQRYIEDHEATFKIANTLGLVAK